MKISDYIALCAAIVAIVALAWQIWTSNKQSKMHTFLAYTQRYQDIVKNFPIGVESKDFELSKEKNEKESLLRWMRSYFDLCSEEYYLNENKFIDNKVWILWEGGIKDSISKPAFVQAWNIIQDNGYYDSKFANYINDLITQRSNV